MGEIGFLPTNPGARRKATDDLSEEARVVMARGFAEGWTAERVAQAVQDATGEVVAVRTVARRAAEWRESRRRFDVGVERWKQLMEAKRQSGADVSAMIEAIAQNALIENPNLLDDADPIRMTRTALAAQELELKRRKVAVQERAVAALEKKLAMAEEKEARLRAVETAARRGEITAEERAQRVDEILGLGGAA